VIVQGRTVPWPTDADSAGPWARTVWVLRPTWLFETCNIAYRRKDLVAVGGFPGRAEAPATITGRPTGEDALLGWKVVDLGSRLVFEPEALVHHRNFTESYLDWLLEHRGKAVFPALVARNPLARRTLWARWFLAPRTAAFDLAVVGGLLWMATKRPHWAVSMAPWVWLALPEASQRGGAHPAVRLAQLALGDLVGFTSLVKGSLRSRSIVL
jgi:hypothetical protein